MLWLLVKLHLHRPAASYLLPFDTLPKNAPLTPFLSHSLLFHIFPPFVFNCLRTHPPGGGGLSTFSPLSALGDSVAKFPAYTLLDDPDCPDSHHAHLAPFERHRSRAASMNTAQAIP